MNKILVIGQTPPPFYGQAIMINYLINAKFVNLRIYHIRMDFSDSIVEIGKKGIKKIYKLIKIILRIIYVKYKYNINIVYYPPAGQNINAIIRDLFILSISGFLFKKKIYHFRAAGLSEFLQNKNIIIQNIIKRIYGVPNCSIQLSYLNPKDGEYFNSKNIKIIPNGIPDIYNINKRKNSSEKLKLLFVGIIKRSKGIFDLINSIKYINSNIDLELNIVGTFDSIETKTEIELMIHDDNLLNYVKFTGALDGFDKWNIYYNSDILCFPTFYENESFGNVLLEAMMFELPIIATSWRSIPSIITDGEEGFLVPINSPKLIAERIELLSEDEQLRRKMGKKGRNKFLNKYTIDKHLSKMEKVFNEIINSK